MKFSILMINYNNEKTLERAIRSALDQDYPDIEVICVDDASTDKSHEIIKSFARNENFIAVYHEKNSGMTCGRLSGIEKASGDYILFLDSDDMLKPNCCSALAKVLQRKRYDMLAFGTEVEYSVVKSKAEKAAVAAFLTPLYKELNGENYRRIFYEERLINHTIWNKCFSKELACKAAANMYKDYINFAEDYYFNFVAGQYVSSYFGIPDKLICYSFGEGISTTADYNNTKFANSLNSLINVIKLCREFAQKQNLEAFYYNSINLYEREIIATFLYRIRILPHADRDDAARLILDKFGTEQFILTLNDKYYNSFEGLANYVDLGKLFPFTRKPIKTIGLYYHRLYNGGTENVLSQMSYFLTALGYSVVVITDEDENPLDYPLADGVKRICIGTKGSEPGSYAIRYNKLRDCILDNSIDLFINNAVLSPLSKLDLCTVKSTGCAYIPFSHTTHIASIIEGYHDFGNQAAYRYADAIITLSAADKVYWSRINSNVFQVDNPVPYIKSFLVENSDSAKHELLWVGRADDKNKNLADALEILYLVLQRIGNTNLRICGYMGKNAQKAIFDRIEQLGIGDHVIYEGYKTDLSEFYSKAELLLFTSDFEGFSLVIAESLAHGLPIVCYELPYMTMAKHSEAVFSVPWKNLEAAADAVVGLLQNDEKRKMMSEAALSEADAFSRIDTPSMWKKIIAAVSEEKKQNVAPSEDEFREYCAASELAYRQLLMRRTWELHNDSNNEILRSVYSSKRYKIGSVLLYFPSKIKGAIWCLRNRGLRYTASLFIDKSRNLLRKLFTKTL